jgi:hypothetical protein
VSPFAGLVGRFGTSGAGGQQWPRDYLSSVTPSLGKAFSSEVRERLVHLGWRKRAGDVFTLGDDEFIGWLGLNRATKNQPLGINPVIGVRYQTLERQVAFLNGATPHQYVPPTLSSSVGYLTPESAYIEVKVQSEADVGPAADQVADLVTKYGLKFITQKSDIAEISHDLEAGRYSIRQYADYRLPVLYGLMGDTDKARELASVRVADRAARTDAEADAYRAFASALGDWLTTI